MRTAKSCGPDTSAVGVKSVEATPPMTETKKPELRGEREISRKPSRAGMPGDSGGPVVTNSCAFYFAREAAGALGARHSPRPYLWGGSFLQDSGKLCRGNAELCLHVIASEAKQSSFSFRGTSWIASLRSQ